MLLAVIVRHSYVARVKAKTRPYGRGGGGRNIIVIITYCYCCVRGRVLNFDRIPVLSSRTRVNLFRTYETSRSPIWWFILLCLSPAEVAGGFFRDRSSRVFTISVKIKNKFHFGCVLSKSNHHQKIATTDGEQSGIVIVTLCESHVVRTEVYLAT